MKHFSAEGDSVICMFTDPVLLFYLLDNLRRVQQCERSPRARCTGTRFYKKHIQVGTPRTLRRVQQCGRSPRARCTGTRFKNNVYKWVPVHRARGVRSHC